MLGRQCTVHVDAWQVLGTRPSPACCLHRLQFFVSEFLLPVCTRLGGVGKPEVSNQRLGLKKYLEVDICIRNSCPFGQNKFACGSCFPLLASFPPLHLLLITLAPLSDFSTNPLLPWSSGSRCSCISPAACLH